MKSRTRYPIRKTSHHLNDEMKKVLRVAERAMAGHTIPFDFEFARRLISKSFETDTIDTEGWSIEDHMAFIESRVVKP